MRLKPKDMIATLLVVAIGAPYVGYLVRGEMPFVQDARDMAAVGLVLGLVAYLVVESEEDDDPTDKVERRLMLQVLMIGAVTLALAETAAAEVLLAVFMVAILAAWATTLAAHAGVLPRGRHPTTTR